MATVAKNSRTNQITLGSDSAGPFNVGFRLFDDDGLEIYVDGELQTVTTDYTISSSYENGYDDAATITFTSAQSSGSVIDILGNMAPDREADYTNGDPQLTAKLNIEFGRVWASLSEVKRNASRAIRSMVGNLAAFTPENGKALIFVDGVPTMGPTADEIESAQGYAEAAGVSAAAALASATEAALYDGPTVDEFSDLASVTPAMVDVGGFIRVIAKGWVYQRVASGGDLDYTGSGGCQWAVQPNMLGAVTPEQWGADNQPDGSTYTDSYNALQAAFDYARDNPGSHAMLTGAYAHSTRLTLDPAADVRAGKNASLVPYAGSGLTNCIQITAGNANGPISLPVIANFTGTAIENNAQLCKVYCKSVNTCGVGLKIVADASNNGGNSHWYFGAMSSVTQPFEFACTTGGYVQGTRIEAQFITNATNLILFSGDAIPMDGQVIEIGSVDVTEGGGHIFRNTTGGTVHRMTCRVSGWFGGDGFVDASPCQINASGEDWNDCHIDLCNNFPITQDNMIAGEMLATNWRLRGVIAKGQAVEMTTATSLDGTFNSGNALYQTDFVVKMTLGTDLAADATRPRYFYHVLADGAYPMWSATILEGASGVVIDSINDNAGVPGRVVVTLRNTGTSAITASTVILIAVRRH